MKIKFVLLASMRTGSNLLNSYLNQYQGVVCHGEAFNPAFVGIEPKYLEKLGLQRGDVKLRDADTHGFLDRLMEVEADAVGLHMFPGHNREILQALLEDPSVKKLCLRRSLFHSFVSLQIARKTDVWRVSAKGQPAELPLDQRRITFRPEEFDEYRQRIDNFWKHVFKVLSATGQDHFPIWYRHLNNVETINGVVEFLALPGRKKRLRMAIERQNPEPLEEIVDNWPEMIQHAKKIGLAHQI